MKNYLIEKRLKLIKLLIIIHYLYEIKKARRLPEGTALGFEAFNDLYDQGKRLTSIEALTKTNTTINNYEYTYNKIGLKTSEKRLHDNDLINNFTYDSIARLTKMEFDKPEQGNPSKTISVKFDKLSNILNLTEEKNNQTKQLISEINSTLNQYNKFDDITFDYDKNGNTTKKGSWTYTYDYKNKIITATNGSKTISFEYDPFGRRISKSNGNQTTHYYYSGNQVIEERDDSDKLLKQYIYGNLIDEIIRMDKYNNNTIENSFYYHTDSIGNITAITDKDGKIVERYKYNIYGSPEIYNDTGNPITESAIGNDYLFQSRRYDPELHLYYYRARAYDPEIGRFLQTDPLGYKDSMNLYQAMNMNGWGFVDPWGTFLIELQTNNLEFFSNNEYRKYEYRFMMTPTFKITFRNKAESIIKALLDIYSTTKKIKFIIKGEKAWKRIYKTLKLILKGKKFLSSLSEQDATVKNPFVLEKSLSTKEKLLHFIQYKIKEFQTDVKLKKLYKEMYGDKGIFDGLSTIEMVKYLKEVKKRYGKEVEEIYPEFSKILTYAVKEGEPDSDIKDKITSKKYYDALVGEYREYYLRMNGLDIYKIPTDNEIYRYLRDMWIEMQEYFFKKY